MDYEQAYAGIDPSLVASGVVSIVNGPKNYITGTVKSKPSGDLPYDEITRIVGIRDKVMEKLPDNVGLVAIEGLAYMVSKTSALMQLAGLNYLLREFLARTCVPFVIVPPSTLKKYATGKGNCEKSMVLLKVFENFGVSMANDNEADAYVLAHIAMSLSHRTHKLPKYQEEVLDLLTPQL
jgi:crossover junction endodeoxyribonuclease RuvC